MNNGQKIIRNNEIRIAMDEWEIISKFAKMLTSTGLRIASWVFISV